MEVIAHEKGVTVSQQVEQALLQNSNIGTIQLEVDENDDDVESGDEDIDNAVKESNGFFVKKADIKRAWELKQKKLKAREKEKAAILAAGGELFDKNKKRETPKKLHAPVVQAKMNEIYR